MCENERVFRSLGPEDSQRKPKRKMLQLLSFATLCCARGWISVQGVAAALLAGFGSCHACSMPTLASDRAGRHDTLDALLGLGLVRA